LAAPNEKPRLDAVSVAAPPLAAPNEKPPVVDVVSRLVVVAPNKKKPLADAGFAAVVSLLVDAAPNENPLLAALLGDDDVTVVFVTFVAC
jgi:hypothetical protein